MSERYPLKNSIGAAIRRTHRSFTQHLETYLAPYGVALGSWYYLRALWEEDGITQHELSLRVGTVDPTSVQQLRLMESAGLIERRRSDADRRKVNVYLTDSGRALRSRLEPVALAVNRTALRGLTDGEIGFLRLVLARMQENLAGASPSSMQGQKP